MASKKASGECETACLRILELVEGLALENIPPQVVDSILQGELVNDFDREQLNVVTQGITSATLTEFERLLKIILKSTDKVSDRRQSLSGEEKQRGLWSYLTGRKFNRRNLLVLLHHLQSENKNAELGFAAGNLYLTLLQVPGSMTYNIFHPILFRGALNLLKYWKSQGWRKYIFSLFVLTY